jgi:hypothetical protein
VQAEHLNFHLEDRSFLLHIFFSYFLTQCFDDKLKLCFASLFVRSLIHAYSDYHPDIFLSCLFYHFVYRVLISSLMRAYLWILSTCEVYLSESLAVFKSICFTWKINKVCARFWIDIDAQYWFIVFITL